MLIWAISEYESIEYFDNLSNNKQECLDNYLLIFKLIICLFLGNIYSIIYEFLSWITKNVTKINNSTYGSVLKYNLLMDDKEMNYDVLACRSKELRQEREYN